MIRHCIKNWTTSKTSQGKNGIAIENGVDLR
jgi:hypothetical protein